MDLSSAGITYILLVIPTLFALAVVAQGIYKIGKKEADGSIALASGLLFLGFIAAAYFFFIKW